ncbi:DNA polymerase III epsilon subunit [hydrothermal vent metagenome]|uniref:DNA polymerase III subunit epsilon n=1 Tax=hydrothermal vent metagenome TaxID=652676 RepID=A0A3B0Y3S3_9ZZZZ
MVNRQIVLDTETTGLEAPKGHRIIEIGCVELINRKPTENIYHQYIRPDREIDAGAMEVHGITNEFLADKPRFSDIADDFLEFIRGAELVIHNAPFDVGFINHEFKRLADNKESGSNASDLIVVSSICNILDTLVLARDMHPGQKNNLDALCKRYMIDNSQREKHGALLDAEILAEVYLAMTGGQSKLILDDESSSSDQGLSFRRAKLDIDLDRIPVISASLDELELHEQRLSAIDKESGGQCLWFTHKQ